VRGPVSLNPEQCHELEIGESFDQSTRAAQVRAHLYRQESHSVVHDPSGALAMSTRRIPGKALQLRSH
jgi:hypothetical protein